jgi:hypothetical protein
MKPMIELYGIDEAKERDRARRGRFIDFVLGLLALVFINWLVYETLCGWTGLK